MTNLYFDPAHASVVRELERDLLDWIVTTTRPATALGVPGGRRGPQVITRYNNPVNADGKFHPDRLKDAAAGNYI